MEGRAELKNAEGIKCRLSAGTREFFSYVPQGNTIFAGSIAENMRIVKEDATDEEIEEAETEIFDLAFDFQMDYDIDISVVIQNKERFNYWLGALPFYNNVQKEGIVLNG